VSSRNSTCQSILARAVAARPIRQPPETGGGGGDGGAGGAGGGAGGDADGGSSDGVRNRIAGRSETQTRTDDPVGQHVAHRLELGAPERVEVHPEVLLGRARDLAPVPQLVVRLQVADGDRVARVSPREPLGARGPERGVQEDQPAVGERHVVVAHAEDQEPGEPDRPCAHKGFGPETPYAPPAPARPARAPVGAPR